VDSFHEDAEIVYINPDTCIDCGACVPECPVQAIFADSDVPEKYKSYIALNAAKSKELPIINQKKTPLAPPK
jgi:ferredoxin